MRSEFWALTVRRALTASDHPTVGAFLRAHPRVPWTALGERLGVPPICVQLYAQDEARALGTVEAVLRDDLVRRLAELLPRGWGTRWSRRTAVWDAWDTDVAPGTLDRCAAAWRHLERLAHPSWRPAHAGDRLLIDAFAAG